jgi:hypothetical protein
VTFQYHGFGNSGGSSNAIANGMVPDTGVGAAGDVAYSLLPVRVSMF